jgi:hypothetical protein
MRPQYLKDIISLSAGEAGQKALRALTKLCNFLLSGQLPSEICHLLYGASLCALNKKDGGIRPIAIGNCLRRLTSKLACFQSRNIVNSYLSPHQLGVATKLGCEAAIHTTRTFVNNDQNRGKVLLKLDFKNAFNSVERDCILKEVQCHTPLLYPYLYQCYRNPSTLFFGNHLISSSVGVQQGDPCGPMIFSLAIQPIILSLEPTYRGIRRFKIKEIPFREDFPCHSTWKRCKHSGHFSRFRNIIGNFCIIKQKCLCNYVII